MKKTAMPFILLHTTGSFYDHPLYSTFLARSRSLLVQPNGSLLFVYQPSAEFMLKCGGRSWVMELVELALTAECHFSDCIIAIEPIFSRSTLESQILNSRLLFTLSLLKKYQIDPEILRSVLAMDQEFLDFHTS